MSNFYKKVRSVSGNHSEKKLGNLISQIKSEIEKEAQKGRYDYTHSVHNRTESIYIVEYFKKDGFGCSVYEDPAEDYGDIDLYEITISWSKTQ